MPIVNIYRIFYAKSVAAIRNRRAQFVRAEQHLQEFLLYTEVSCPIHLTAAIWAEFSPFATSHLLAKRACRQTLLWLLRGSTGRALRDRVQVPRPQHVGRRQTEFGARVKHVADRRRVNRALTQRQRDDRVARARDRLALGGVDHQSSLRPEEGVADGSGRASTWRGRW
jgi:hypothetical protein